MKLDRRSVPTDITNALCQKPKVYLAGKIRKNCWRHTLVTGLRGHSWGDGPLTQTKFTYVGPFFVSCDHGCFHTRNSHGFVAIRGDNACPGREIHAEFDAPHPEVASLCQDAVAKSDLMFCYIESRDCYGTLAEIGYAHAHRVPVVIAFAPEIATPTMNDLWFACAMARSIHYSVRRNALPNLLEQAIRRYTWK